MKEKIFEALNKHDFEAVRRLSEKGLRKTPNSAFLNSMLATALLEAGHHLRAVVYFRKALAIESNKDAEYNLGRALFLANQHSEAENLLAKYVSQVPDDVDGLSMLGLTYLAVGKPDKGINVLERAQRIAPNDLKVTKNLALAYKDNGSLEKALRSFETLVTLDRNNPSIIAAYARFLADLKRVEHAFSWAQEALSLEPDDPAANLLFAEILIYNSIAVDPEPYIQVALANSVTEKAAFKNKLLWLCARKRYEDAISLINSVNRKILQDPETRDFIAQLGFAAAIHLFDLSWFFQIETKLNLPRESRVTDLFSGAHYFEDCEGLLKCCEVSLNRLTDNLESGTVPQRNVGAKHPKIGFFSGEFCSHPVGTLFIEVFERLVGLGYSCYVFSNSPQHDEITERYKKAASKFFEVRELNDWELTRFARKQGLDLAVDLNGHTGKHRLAPFKARIAPVQMTYLGFPCTTGLAEMDYILLDRYVYGPCNEELFSEKCVDLGRCFMPRDASVDVQIELKRKSYGLPESKVVFCVFNKPSKFSQKTVDVFAEIAKRTQGVLWFGAMAIEAQIRVKNTLLRAGVDESQIIFAERVDSKEEHLGRIALADLYLDTYPYGGHTSFSDALYSGVPALTLYGESPVSRVGYSYLAHLGLSDRLAFQTERSMVHAACDLCEQPESLADLRKLMRKRILETRLFDMDEYVSHFQKAIDSLFRGT